MISKVRHVLRLLFRSIHRLPDFVFPAGLAFGEQFLFR
jgi:hypothetical protein